MRSIQRLAFFALMAIVAAALPARAQTYGFEFGGNLDSAVTPHTAGHLSVLVGDGTNFSYTTLMARGPAEGKFTYLLEEGYLRKVKDLTARLSLWADIQGGVSNSQTATSGALNSGGALAFKIKPQWLARLAGGVSVNPSDGGVAPRIAFSVVFMPAGQ